MNVAAIIVTRGDHDLYDIWTSLPPEWTQIEWNNSREKDLSVYGRYAAIERTDAELIYVQDDDCIVSDPKKLVSAWEGSKLAAWDPRALWHEHPDNLREIREGRHVVCNMPQEFRHDFYSDHALVGFGAVFHRDAPGRAFERFWGFQHELGVETYHRTCDVLFTALTPRILVDVPYKNLPWATADERMYRQRAHNGERKRMLDLVLDKVVQ